MKKINVILSIVTILAISLACTPGTSKDEVKKQNSVSYLAISDNCQDLQVVDASLTSYQGAEVELTQLDGTETGTPATPGTDTGTKTTLDFKLILNIVLGILSTVFGAFAFKFKKYAGDLLVFGHAVIDAGDEVIEAEADNSISDAEWAECMKKFKKVGEAWKNLTRKV